MLAAAGAGVAALAAQALGRPQPASATHGDVHLGGTNQTDTVTTIQNTWSTGDAIRGIAAGAGVGVRGDGQQGVRGEGSMYGVEGSSTYGTGVRASAGGHGVHASSANGAALYGDSASDTWPAVWATSGSGRTGVQGNSGNVPHVGPAKTGVYGYAAQDAAARGVTGETTAGRGVQGIATNGVGGHFSAAAAGTALQAQGQVRFSTAGLTAVAAGASSKTISAGVDLVGASKVLCTLESNQAAQFIQRVTKNLSANTFTVYLNVAVKSGRTVKVAWFVIS